MPHVAVGAGLALRLLRAVFVLVRAVVLWAVLGGVAGAAYASGTGSELFWAVLFGASHGALVGVCVGFLIALRTLLARTPR